MKFLLAISVVLTSISFAFAQSPFGITVLPQVGVTYSDVYNEDSRVVNTFRPGLMAGASFIFSGQRDFGPMLGVHYVQKGGESVFETHNGGYTNRDQVTFRLNYIDASLQIRDAVAQGKNFRFFLRAGLIYSIGLNSSSARQVFRSYGPNGVGSSFSGTSKINFVQDLSARTSVFDQLRTSMSFCAGLGVVVRGINIDFGYSGGLLIIKTKDFQPMASNLLQLSVGIPVRKINL